MDEDTFCCLIITISKVYLKSSRICNCCVNVLTKVESFLENVWMKMNCCNDDDDDDDGTSSHY